MPFDVYTTRLGRYMAEVTRRASALAAQPAPAALPAAPVYRPDTYQGAVGIAAPSAARPPAPQGDLTPAEQALARRIGVAPTRADYNAMMEDAQGIEMQNALGPGASQPQYVRELQGFLTEYGYPTPVTGVFDDATIASVTRFKLQYNPKSLWHRPDGSPGCFPLIDEATKAAFMFHLVEKRLGAGAGPVDELGIFRPSEAWKAALGMMHRWVYSQPMRDAAGPYDVLADFKAKRETGPYVACTLPDGRVTSCYAPFPA